MTSRDLEIIDFLSDYKIATTSVLCHFFFNSIHSCYKVLHRLTESGHIKRMKIIEGSQNCEYAYYLKKPPAQFKHSLMLIDFYSKWDKKENVTMFDTQKKLGSIIPDAIMQCKNKTYLVEIELSNKGFNYMKYEKFYISGEYKSYFSEMPTVLIYGNTTIPNNTMVRYRIFTRK